MRRALAIMLLLCYATCVAVAQQPVAAVERWLATVDSATQQIVLTWSPSSSPAAQGYHICTGDTCREYAVVEGRFDTMFVCTTHQPTEAHTYRLHVFDTAGNVSALTPRFGNIALAATVPECSTTVQVRWNAYGGMPCGVRRYALFVKQEPIDNDFISYYVTDSTGELRYAFDIETDAQRVLLMVKASDCDGGMVSYSNIVAVERRTAEAAQRADIVQAQYDSTLDAVSLAFATDAAYTATPYVLWRSIGGSPWQQVRVFDVPPASYIDRDLFRRSADYCYQLSVTDACDLNPRYSATQCATVPPPPPAAVAAPSAIIAAADGPNGTFLPQVRSLMGDVYELSIYDRYGRQVFHTTTIGEGWQPPANTPQGAYAYALRVRYKDNTIATHTGTFSVIK